MDEKQEQLWLEGERAANVGILRFALKALGYESPESEHTKWILEREAAIAQLRMVCREHGDNDWPDTLHLADIIDKHLRRHLSD